MALLSLSCLMGGEIPAEAGLTKTVQAEYISNTPAVCANLPTGARVKANTIRTRMEVLNSVSTQLIITSADCFS